MSWKHYTLSKIFHILSLIERPSHTEIMATVFQSPAFLTTLGDGNAQNVQSRLSATISRLATQHRAENHES